MITVPRIGHSSSAGGSPIRWAAGPGAGPALGFTPRSLAGVWLVAAATPLLWSWFAFALRTP